MKKFFVLLVLSSMFPLCAMEQDARGDESEALFAQVAWEGYIQGLQEQLSRLKDSSSIDEHLAEVYESILGDAHQGVLKNAKTTLQNVQKYFDDLCFAKVLPHSVSAPADLPAGRERRAGEARVVAEDSSSDSSGAGSEDGARHVHFNEIVAVTEFPEDEPVKFLKEYSDSDEDSEGGSSDSAVSGCRSSDEESDAQTAESGALWYRIYQLQGRAQSGIDVTRLEDALGDPDANLAEVEAMIAECEKDALQAVGVSREDEDSETDDSEWSVEEGADDRDGDAPSGEAPEAPEWLVDVQRRISELMAGQLVDVTGLLQEALSIKAGDKDSSKKIQDLLRRIAEVEDLQKAALVSDDEEEGSDGEPEVAAPAALAAAAFDADAEAEGTIGDLDAADGGASDRARVKKQLELAAKLDRLRDRNVEVADLWHRLEGEGTDLADLEKEIDALEAGLASLTSISPSSYLGGKAGTAPADVGRGWLKRAVQLPVLGKVAGVTFGAFVIGGLTHRHVKTRRAQGKSTIFDRMRQWTQQKYRWFIRWERQQAKPIGK